MSSLKQVGCAVFLCAVCAVLQTEAHAAEVVLKLVSFQNGNHKFYHALLEQSLKAAGHSVKIESEVDLPQPRIVAYLDSGALSLHWMLQTKERDSKYLPINKGLTQGLIGKRLLLIPKGNEAGFANAATLEQFKSLGKTAGLGQGWFDVSVWKESGLLVREQGGDWKQLYPMLAAKDRGVDYFPRGATEILAEAKAYPELAIEPKLVLVYARDIQFYVSKANASLKPVIESALTQAERSGLMAKLIEEYFGPSISSLGLDKRTRIELKNPTGL